MTNVQTPVTAPAPVAGLTEEVEAMLNPAEQEGRFHNDAECAGLILKAGAELLAPPPPRPKKR